MNRIPEIGSRVGGFAYLNMVTQMKNQAAVAFYQNISEKLTDYSKPLIFLSLEINQLPAEKIEDWLKNPKPLFISPGWNASAVLNRTNFRKRWKRCCSKSR